MVVEGHVRLTAYAMDADTLEVPVEVLLGTGAKIRGWSLY